MIRKLAVASLYFITVESWHNGYLHYGPPYRDPCRPENNPCNAAVGHAHRCETIPYQETTYALGRFIPPSYRCYCVNGYFGENCEHAPQCTGTPCMGNGDVHYHTFDGTPHDNQGFCQYVLSTNVDCGANWPIDANNYDWAKWRYKEYFMVVADHSPIPLSNYGYNQEVSRLTGLQIYFTAKARNQGSIWRLTIGEDMSGWKLQYWNVNFGWLKVSCGSACSWTNAEGNFIGSWNSPDKNMAMRVNGATTDIYLGAGRSGDTTWTVQNNSPVRDFLVRIQYTKDQFNPSAYSYEGWYGSVNIYPNCELANQVCGVCGDYNNQADFNRVGNKRDWERVLERTHFWNLPRMTEGELRNPPTFTEPHQCPYTNLDGNPVPTQELAQRNNGRKKRSIVVPLCVERDAYQRACNRILESPFDTCDLPKQPLIDNCVFDACATGGTEPFLENMLTQYVYQCNASPTLSNRIRSWRTADFYPLTCGANSEYHSCTAHSCHGSAGECDVDQRECQAELQYSCIEGCFCRPGFILNGIDCVEITPAICPDPVEEDHDVVLEIQNTSHLIEIGITTEPVDENISVDDFLSHGCYCSRLDNSEVNKGKAVSELDQVCRQLSHCDKCSVEDECADASGYPFFVKLVSGNSLVCDDTKNSQCQQAQCECSVTAADNIIEYVMNENIQSIGAEACVAKAGEGKSFECCGAGYHWMLYDVSSNLECGLDSENLPILTEIGSPENVRRQFPGKN